ncbi:ADP-ribosyltransferase [Vibrio sp. Of14-4]|uniref:ADP-ribosyltransferase n=1 Tax=Vibrio sp. Of14-4 TaxID=2724878 RepID=UPI001EF3B0C7|nr:ADP-ribosyltransferase [Vibrio sp. Of14-4]
MPRFQGKVYRGTLTKTGLIDQLNVGDLVYDLGFMSTSVLPEVAMGFAEDTETTIGHSSTLLEIDLTANGYSVPAIAVTPREAEVIVSPKTYMKVQAIATQGSRKLIALETIDSIEGHTQAFNLYTSEPEAIQFVESSSDALHLTCPFVI